MATYWGWLFFFGSIIAFTLVVTEPVGLRGNLMILVSSAAMLSLAVAFLQKGLLVDCFLICGLAFGLLTLHWFSPKLTFIKLTDGLLLVAFIMNLAVGLGLLLFPEGLLASALYAPIRDKNLVLAVIFLFSALPGVLSFFKNVFRGGFYGRLLSIPWAFWMGIFLFNFKSSIVFIVAAPLFLVLFFVDIVPWKKIILPPRDVLGRRVLTIVFISNSIVLLVLWFILNTESAILVNTDTLVLVSRVALLSFNALYLFSLLLIATVNLTINGLVTDTTENVLTGSQDSPQIVHSIWGRAAARMVSPLREKQDALESEIRRQEKVIEGLNSELSKNKRRMSQLNLLNDLERQLEPILDAPVSAQLTTNIIQRAFNAPLVIVFTFDTTRHELVATASAGELTGIVPVEFRLSIQKGIPGRATRLHKSQYVIDTRLDEDYLPYDGQNFLSEVAIPMIYQGQVKGIICMDDYNADAFSSMDIDTLETAANRLVSAWNRSDYDRRLRELIRAGITLSSTLETETAIQETASATQQTLGARFVYITLVDQERTFSRVAYAGYAPRLLQFLNNNPSGNTLLQSVINSTGVVRWRDIRKVDDAIELDNTSLRGFMGFPIRLRGLRIGAILAFGKQGGLYFSEDDVSLANLISNQAAAAIETTWLYQELRSTLNTATLLYQLSIKVIQAEGLTEAAAVIAETAKNLSNATMAGIVLFTPRTREIEAQVQIDASGLHPGTNHPMQLVRQAMQTGQVVLVAVEKMATLCLPLQTPHREYGVLWLNILESYWYNNRYAANLQTLANQAAVALERGILLVETRRQGEQIKEAYEELELTYDQTLEALSSALDARDHETEGHCRRVAKLTKSLGAKMGLSSENLKALERGALLHDIGKIGISDSILLKPGPLTDDEWRLMRQHPDIGARMVEGIPFLQESIPVVRYHQERWDGSGYPIGLKELEIPIQARVFAVADVFDALTSTRPYRQRISVNEALEYVKEQAGNLFDPDIVDMIEETVNSGEIYEYIAL